MMSTLTRSQRTRREVKPFEPVKYEFYFPSACHWNTKHINKINIALEQKQVDSLTTHFEWGCLDAKMSEQTRERIALTSRQP